MGKFFIMNNVSVKTSSKENEYILTHQIALT